MSGLNAGQAAAARALAGRVVIRAGAGTGKTKTLTERFVNALEPASHAEVGAVDIEGILTITFTEKAAGEIADRVRRALRARGRREEALRVDAAWIGTIHGACSRLLRQYALEIGLDPRFAVVGAVDDGRLKEQAFEEAMCLIVESEEGERLVTSYSWAQLFDAVERYSRIRRTGRVSDEAREAPGGRTPHGVWSDAVSLFSLSAQEMASCGASGSTPHTFAGNCLSAVESLHLVDVNALEPFEAFARVYSAVDEFKAGRRVSHEGATQIRDRVMIRCGELMDEAAEGAVGGLESAFLRLADGYEAAYRAAKRERSLLDFDDLQVEVAGLLEAEPDLLETRNPPWTLAMIDEFQDTDALQLRIIEQVAGENLCTVGDEYQSIYSFRGADIAVYRSHTRLMHERGAREFTLDVNYRSHPQVLGFVNRVFSSAAFAGGSLVELEAGRVEPDPPEVPAGEPRIDIVVVEKCSGTDLARDTEAASVARRLARLRDEFGVDPGGMVVLTRAYTHAHVYADALRREGFEVSVAGGDRFLSAGEVLACRALLRAIANPRDEVALADVLASETAAVSDDALYRLRAAAGQEGRRCDLWGALGRAEDLLRGSDLTEAVRIRHAITAARGMLGRETLSHVLLAAVELCGFRDVLRSRGTEGRRAFANVLALARMASEFERSGGSGPAAFVEHLDDRQRFGEHVPAAVIDGSSQVVRIMSIHASKGLEFPVVAVVENGSAIPEDRSIIRTDTTGGRLSFALRPPLKSTKNIGDGLTPRFREFDRRQRQARDEEASRLFYVGCTRAREVLVLTGAVKDVGEPCSGSGSMLDRMRAALPGLVESARIDEEPTVVEVDPIRVRVQVVAGTGSSGRDHSVRGFVPGHDAPGPGAEPGWFPGPTDQREQTAASDHGPESEELGRSAPPGVRRVSYTDLAEFERCERRYLLDRRLRVGSVDWVDDRSATRFGSAVHAVLQLMEGPGVPPAGRLEAVSRHHHLDEESRAALHAAVEVFAGSGIARELYSTGPVRHEWGFVLRLGEEGDHVDLHGSLDAYSRIGDHGLVVDYKTGTSGDESELADRYRLQARCYALVALSHGCSTVDVVFCRPQVTDDAGEPQSVRLSFTEGDADGIRDELLGLWRRIESSAGEPLARWERAVCRDCRHSGGLCPRVPGRARRSAD